VLRKFCASSAARSEKCGKGISCRFLRMPNTTGLATVEAADELSTRWRTRSVIRPCAASTTTRHIAGRRRACALRLQRFANEAEESRRRCRRLIRDIGYVIARNAPKPETPSQCEVRISGRA